MKPSFRGGGIFISMNKHRGKSMKKKTKTITVGIIISVFLIGIVSAGLIDYFGRITGEVTVEEPVFYLNGHWAEAYYDLFVNEIPSSEEEVHFSDGNRILFISEPLEVDNFYQARFDIIMWAKTNNSGNIMQFQVVRINPNLDEEIICVPDSVILTNTLNYVKKTTFCPSSGEISLNPDDRIGLIISGAGITSEYWIRTGENDAGDYSRIEVTAT